MKAISRYFIHAPNKLLLTDAVGAAISAFLLTFLVSPLESTFGIPLVVTRSLVVPPLFFIAFDLISVLFFKQKGSALRTIALLNLLYCLTSLSLILAHSKSMTFVGWGYIIGEVLLVSCLAAFELKIARKIMRL